MAVLESLRLRRDLSAVPVRILVNGTRGKSTVTRLIAAALREAGIPTLAKTTGSAARVINLDGTERPLLRPFGARLTEQKAFAKEAARLGARAVVVECMALRPESQAMMRWHFVRPTLSVITNARVDHIEEIGATPRRTAEVLSLAVPRGSPVLTVEPLVSDYHERAIVVDSASVSNDTLERFDYPAFRDNVALTLKATMLLGVDAETALRGMARARPDAGVDAVRAVAIRRVGQGGGTVTAYVVNAFAANDVASTEALWRDAQKALPPGLPVIMLYNNRADREYRIREFSRLPQRIEGLRLVAAFGDYPRKVARAFARSGFEAEGIATAAPEEALASLAGRAGGSFIMLCVGNFHGFGEALTAYVAGVGRGARPAERPLATIDPEEASCFNNR